jgi:hypothetical protein
MNDEDNLEIMDQQVSKHLKGIKDKQVSKKIQEMIGHMQCPKDFKCASSGFKKLCKAKDSGMADYVECLEDKPLSCKFVILFGEQHFCRCPLGVYIIKNLQH